MPATQAFCFRAVRACIRSCVIIYYKFINPVSYKAFVGISPTSQLGAVAGGTLVNSLEFEFKGQRWRSRRNNVWSNKHFGRHFLTCVRNSRTYFNETRHSYSLPGPHDTDGTF